MSYKNAVFSLFMGFFYIKKDRYSNSHCIEYCNVLLGYQINKVIINKFSLSFYSLYYIPLELWSTFDILSNKSEIFLEFDFCILSIPSFTEPVVLVRDFINCSTSSHSMFFVVLSIETACFFIVVLSIVSFK